MLVKVDLENVYKWGLDNHLLFGVRQKESPTYTRLCSPIWPEVVANCLQWMFHQQGVRVIHFINDFVIVGRSDSDECHHSVESVLELCKQLEFKYHKNQGVHPEDKISCWSGMVQQWSARKGYTKRELPGPFASSMSGGKTLQELSKGIVSFTIRMRLHCNLE